MTLGAFHSTQNSGNFGWYIKWNGPFRFGPTGILGTSFEGGPLWPVGPVEPKFPFAFDKFVVPSTSLLYPAFKDKMAECSDSMYECSICWNRRTDLEVLLMHSCSSISGGLLYNDLITVSVPFKISLFGVSYCFLNNFARFSRSTLFSDVGTDSLPNSIEESLVMSVISPAPSSDTSNKRRSLEKWEDKHVCLLVKSYLKYKDLFGKPQQSKKKVFEKIAEEFNRTSDVVVTGDQCFRKFKKLELKQKEIEDNNSKTGREKKTWKFHKEMEDYMGDNPTVKPVFTFDTSWGSSSSSSTLS